MGLLRFAFRWIRNFLIFFLVVALMPGLPPKTHFELKPFSITKARELDGPLAPNNYLDGMERLFQGRIIGPEALTIKNNEIYASLATEVVKFSGDHITHVAKFGPPCVPILEEEKCGRPLGLAVDTLSNSLIVADSYYGIWLVDLSTLRKTLLLSPETVYAGKIPRKAKLFNSVAVSKNGDIYWTDSTSDFNRLNGLMSFFANPSGRLFHYNRATKVNTLLVDNLYFANGVALSPNEDFVLVAESAALKITRYYLKGPKAGTSDAFIDGLPGLPDNLKGDNDGLWIAVAVSYDEQNPPIWTSMTKIPIVRQFILRLVHLLEMPFNALQNVYPNYYTKVILNYIGSFESIGPMMRTSPVLMRVDWNGNIIGSLQSGDGSVSSIAEILEVNGYLYLGSFHHPYLGRVKLPDNLARKNIKSETVRQTPTTTAPKATTTTTTTTPRPTTTTPRPTTTTPRPTTTTPMPTTTTPRPTTTTPRPTTTTPSPTTTTSMPTTTTPRPTTTTPRPTTTTPSPTTTTTRQPTTTQTPTITTTTATNKPTEKPAPIHEFRPEDIPPPPPTEKLKVIKRGGERVEL